MNGGDLREHLQAIYDQHGVLTPDLVVQEATPRSHPLHAVVFDRAQREAAAAYYRDRAQELIASVKVVYREADEESPAKEGRYFRAIQNSPNNWVYEPIDEIVKDPLKRALALQDAERRWKELYRAFSDLQEFVAMVAADLEDLERAA